MQILWIWLEKCGLSSQGQVLEAFPAAGEISSPKGESGQHSYEYVCRYKINWKGRRRHLREDDIRAEARLARRSQTCTSHQEECFSFKEPGLWGRRSSAYLRNRKKVSSWSMVSEGWNTPRWQWGGEHGPDRSCWGATRSRYDLVSHRKKYDFILSAMRPIEGF